MLRDYLEIVTDNPAEEVWKRLRWFLDTEYVAELIVNLHGLADKDESNAKKQARQLAYCIRQSEDYFSAASQVGLITRPLLLYYGASCLAWAITLLYQSGACSFDALRKKSKHRSHGLEMSRSADMGKGPANFFKSLSCALRAKDQAFAGTFPLFYESLRRLGLTTPDETYIYFSGKNQFSQSDPARMPRRKLVLPLPENPSLSSNAFACLNALSVLRGLPEVYDDLLRIGIAPNLFQASVWAREEIVYDPRGQTNDLPRVTHHIGFTGYNIDDESMKSGLIEYIQSLNSGYLAEAQPPGMIQVRIEADDATVMSGYVVLPHIVEDLFRRRFIVADPQEYIPEPASHFVLLYMLGMLSRYYPDVWVRVLDEDVVVAELTSTVLQCIHRKFPKLILDHLTRCVHELHA